MMDNTNLIHQQQASKQQKCNLKNKISNLKEDGDKNIIIIIEGTEKKKKKCRKIVNYFYHEMIYYEKFHIFQLNFEWLLLLLWNGWIGA